MTIEKARGVRDFAPQDMIVRNKVINTLRSIFEIYGFLPFQTPMIERLDVLTAKFAAGDIADASKEIFKFKDHGKRDLGLRFDLTVPLARYISQNPTIKLPFKRYEIGRVYRDGPIKLGRYREFIQCDVDTIGVEGVEAEIELLLLAIDSFKKLGLDAYIEINDRNIINKILQKRDIPKSKQEKTIIILDKLKKMGKKEVEKELKNIGIINPKKLLETFSNADKVREICDMSNIDRLLSMLPKKNVVFNPSLARGLSYYTGIVFEGFLKDTKITSSICGGGRYDQMIGLYGNRDIPATGISFGIEPIIEYMRTQKNEIKKTQTKVYLIPIKQFEDSLKIAQKFRKNNILTEIDLLGKGVSKNLDYANNKGIPYVILIGSDELKSKKFKLKDMKSGKEKELSIDKIIEFLKSAFPASVLY